MLIGSSELLCYTRVPEWRDTYHLSLRLSISRDCWRTFSVSFFFYCLFTNSHRWLIKCKCLLPQIKFKFMRKENIYQFADKWESDIRKKKLVGRISTDGAEGKWPKITSLASDEMAWTQIKTATGTKCHKMNGWLLNIVKTMVET